MKGTKERFDEIRWKALSFPYRLNSRMELIDYFFAVRAGSRPAMYSPRDFERLE